jgi:hypothetical protein
MPKKPEIKNMSRRRRKKKDDSPVTGTSRIVDDSLFEFLLDPPGVVYIAPAHTAASRLLIDILKRISFFFAFRQKCTVSNGTRRLQERLLLEQRSGRIRIIIIISTTAVWPASAKHNS